MQKKLELIVSLVQEKIHYLVAQDDLSLAVDLLIELAWVSGNKFYDEALVLSMSIRNFERQTRFGALDFNFSIEEKCKLASRLLSITNALLNNK